MLESLENAKDELKRVDHLIFVSLKYTRTVDVLKNVLVRMIEAYDFMIESMLKYLEEKNMIFEAPTAPHVRATTLSNQFNDEIISEHMRNYIKFKKILKVEDYESINEFRRHVALITEIDGEEVTINIDFLTEYFKTMKEFIKYVHDKIIQ
ncbi:hypothetical protein C0585_01725 [Candidatus Woesearchaeota archaeon]|nr:MAG: hypothetical protein C0585_01725 [Candidatus Woesearchaeota archaeon]